MSQKYKKWALYPGRFQPFHNGHKAHVDRLLELGKRVAIAVRDTPVSDSDPYTMADRKAMIGRVFHAEILTGTVSLITIPDIEGIYYGRRVGFNVEQVPMPEEVEAVSGTGVRAGATDVPPEVAEYIAGLEA